MGPLLDDVSVIQDKDQIRIADGRQPVRDHKACPALHQTIHSALNQLLCTSIDGGGRLVQNQYTAVCKHRPRNGEKLFLSLGHICRVLIQHQIVTTRKGTDKVINVGSLCSRFDLLVGRIQSAIADVLPNCSGEQPCILQYHGKMLPQLMPVKAPDIPAVQADGTAVDIVETHQELDNGRLAGARRPDNGDLLPWLYMGCEIMDDDLIRIVPEPDMVEIHFS